jgi:hypothetical protein
MNSATRRHLVAAVIAMTDGFTKPLFGGPEEGSRHGPDRVNKDALDRLEEMMSKEMSEHDSVDFYEKYGDKLAPLNINAWRINHSDCDDLEHPEEEKVIENDVMRTVFKDDDFEDCNL